VCADIPFFYLFKKMDIIASYIKENSGTNAELYLDRLLEAKKSTIHILLTNEFEEKEFDENRLRDYLKRLFKSASKIYPNKLVRSLITLPYLLLIFTFKVYLQ
jgi:hypothetical protein